MSIFSGTHASLYDRMQGHKDYRSECDLLEKAFRRYQARKTRTVVDFGCGTGNHTIAMANRGFRVTGVDRSREMLEIARKKAAASKVAVRWREGDLRTVDAGGTYDAALLMFAVLGYMTENDDLVRALTNVRRHLKPAGLLAFDVWYGPAVLAIKPSNRVKTLTLPKGRIIRKATSTLDTRRHLCQVRYHLRCVNGRTVVSDSEEIHQLRYFFPLELEFFLSQTGFRQVSLTSFPTLDQPPGDSTWNAFIVANAV